MKIIDGVEIKQLKVHSDGRGCLFEVLRDDDEMHDGFDWGQVYFSGVYGDRVKAWHLHKLQTDFVCCGYGMGMIKVGIFDVREGSPTKGVLNVFYIGEQNPSLIRIPKLVYHGWQGLMPRMNLVLSVPDKMYNREAPDEYRETHENLVKRWGRYANRLVGLWLPENG